MRLESRNGNDITVAWPELAGLAPAEPGFVVDGEIVIEHAGKSSFKALAPRMHQRNPAVIGELAASTPATYMIFDLLQIGGRSLIELPYSQRRTLLEQTRLAGPHWQIPHLLPRPGRWRCRRNSGSKGSCSQGLKLTNRPSECCLQFLLVPIGLRSEVRRRWPQSRLFEERR
ncbi:ATP-dependent DNA ligase [Nocardia thailandica]|uniref:ATP-dependent DNA ligase n=1 Tax=Nocardia thailandica TaxID=257275 RepID=UPI0006947C94|nr:hypothetical protein [Nocardia thailandica]